jgi:hypothetical protein
MKGVELYFDFMVTMVFFYTYLSLILQSIHPVQAIPMINMTNPYYERHLEHIGES